MKTSQNIKPVNFVGDSAKDNQTPAVSLIQCSHCKGPGHINKNCWYLLNNPKKLRLIRDTQRSIFNYPSVFFNYIIDNGSEISLVRESTIKLLGAKVQTSDILALSGLGTNIVYSKGRCKLQAVWPTVSFCVVADVLLLKNVDVILGWDVIGRPDLRVEKNC